MFMYLVYGKNNIEKYTEEVFKNMPKTSLPRNSYQHLEYTASTGPCPWKQSRKINR